MNRHYRLPLRTRPKNVSTSVRRRKAAPGLVMTGLIAFGGIVLLFGIGFAAFVIYKQFSHKSPRIVSSGPVATPAASAVPASPSPSATTEILRPLSDPNQSVASSPVVESTPNPTPAKVPAPKPSIAAPPVEEKAAQASESPSKSLSKAARKTLERKRQVAERKRAVLEQMYQNREISTSEYNKGEQEYKEEIQKYRKLINQG